MIFAAMFLSAYTLGYVVARLTHESRTMQGNRADLRKSLVNRR